MTNDHPDGHASGAGARVERYASRGPFTRRDWYLDHDYLAELTRAELLLARSHVDTRWDERLGFDFAGGSRRAARRKRKRRRHLRSFLRTVDRLVLRGAASGSTGRASRK